MLSKSYYAKYKAYYESYYESYYDAYYVMYSIYGGEYPMKIVSIATRCGVSFMKIISNSSHFIMLGYIHHDSIC